MDILISTNTTYMLPTCVFLFSLCKSNSMNKVDIWLAYSDLTDEDFQKIESIISQYSSVTLHKLDVGISFKEKIRHVDVCSYETYYRILALDLLPDDIKRILYLDCDMLVKSDLQELFDMPLNPECPMMVCEDIALYRRNKFEQAKRRTQIPSRYKYFNAGFILFNLEHMRHRRSTGYILDAFVREQDIYRLHDQDILNHMYYDKVEFLPWQLYNIIPGHYYLDIAEFANNKIRFATYNEIDGPNFDPDSQFVQLSGLLSKYCKIIHYCATFKPWKYTRENIWKDFVPFSNYWYDAYEEMCDKFDFMKELH